jgi:hypothetical protein
MSCLLAKNSSPNVISGNNCHLRYEDRLAVTIRALLASKLQDAICRVLGKERGIG